MLTLSGLSGPWRVMTICLALVGAGGVDTPSPSSAVLPASLLALPLCLVCDGLVTVTVGGCSGLTAAGRSGLWGCGAGAAALALVPIGGDEPSCFAGKVKEL